MPSCGRRKWFEVYFCYFHGRPRAWARGAVALPWNVESWYCHPSHPDKMLRNTSISTSKIWKIAPDSLRPLNWQGVCVHPQTILHRQSKMISNFLTEILFDNNHAKSSSRPRGPKTGLGLMIVVASASSSLASWPCIVFEVPLKCFVMLTLKIWHFLFSVYCVDTETVACVQGHSWSF